jgi:hypothetical protein
MGTIAVGTRSVAGKRKIPAGYPVGKRWSMAA